MIARVTIFAILVLSVATYASSPAGNTSTHPQSNVMCCDGDPIGIGK
jgi:hypothetical protein